MIQRLYKLGVIMIAGIALIGCPSLWKHAQILKLYDSGGKVVGQIGGFKVHYPKDNDDSDGKQSWPEEHYTVAITNANVDNAISTSDLAKISSIGVKSKDTDLLMTDTEKYMCDNSIDPANPGFGCRFKAETVGASKKVYIALQLKDGSTWKSDDLDLTDFTESSELGKDVNDVLTGIASGEMQAYTLKTCPKDASGKTVDIKSSEACPCAANFVYSFDKNTCDPKPPATGDASKDCVAPNIYDKTTDKCISAVQPKKPCDNGVALLDGSCGTKCGVNQVQKLGKCQCMTTYIKDPYGAACIVDPQVVKPPPTVAAGSGGGSCSLIR